jgi:hypothetical protein
MRRHLTTIAAIGLAAMFGGVAFAQDAPEESPINPNAANENNISNDLSPGLSDLINFPKLGPKAAMLDLGIDLTDVALTPQGVNSFLASLDPQAQRILLTSCAHYLTTPNSAQSPYTVQFCGVLLGG